MLKNTNCTRKKSFCIIAETNTPNLGDKLITLVLKSAIEETTGWSFCAFLPFSHLSVAVNNWFFIKIYKRIKSMVFYVYTLFRIYRNRRIDNFIIGGGELLRDNGYFHSRLIFWVVSLRLLTPNSKIILFGVGGSFSSNNKNLGFLKRRLLQYVFNSFTYVAVRDFQTRDEINKLFGINVKLNHDIVFLINKYWKVTPKVEKNGYLLVFPVSYSGVISKHENAYKTEEDFYNEILIYLKREKHLFQRCIVTCSNPKQDRNSVLNFYHALKKLNYFECMEIIITEDLIEFVDLISNADCVYSARMHPLIIGDSYGVRSEPVLVSKKLGGYAERYGGGAIKKVNIEKIETELLGTLMELGEKTN